MKMPNEMTPEKQPFAFQRPVCQHLRTKAVYIPGGSWKNLTETNPETHYWCNATMSNVVGPDDQFIDPKGCQGHRSCFQNTGLALAIKTNSEGNNPV